MRLWSGQYGGRKWSFHPAGCGRLQGQLDLLAVMDAVVVGMMWTRRAFRYVSVTSL